MWLLAIDDFLLADVNIPPAMLTNKSSHLGFGVDRRSGIYSSVFFGASSQPATWHLILQCPNEAARHAAIAVLAAPRMEQVRLLAARSAHFEELVTTDASITSVVPHGSSDNLEVTFESNDSVWFAEDVLRTSKTFTSPLDHILHLPAGGNVPTNAVLRITPTLQRSDPTPDVGWRYRRRFVVSNGGNEPLFRYDLAIDLGNTATTVSGGKARADGADVRVWLHGLEQSRSLLNWNTSSTTLWVMVPALPPGDSLTYDVVYGNPAADDATDVELSYPDSPAFDITASSNYSHLYRTSQAIGHAGQGLWPLSSSLEGGSADFGVPGAWQPALTFGSPNNTDNVVQPHAQRLGEGGAEWYQARLYAARWRGPGFDAVNQYAGTDPFDGVTLYNPFGIRAVHADGVMRSNDAHVKTVVTTTVGSQTASDEVLTPHDPPFTRVVVIGRNSGGEGWHVIDQYAGTAGGGGNDVLRLYLPSSGAPSINPSYASGWERTEAAQRVAATDSKGSSPMMYASSNGVSVNNLDDFLLRQYVYPLPAGIAFTTSDTVKGQIMPAEDPNTAGLRTQMTIRVMTSTSVVRATLLGFDTGGLSSEWLDAVVANSANNRKAPRGGALALQANYTTVDGDYLVIEYGFRAHTTGYVGALIRFGDESGVALPEDETTFGLNFYPWIQFSTDLTGPVETSLSPTWTPSRPVKHFGVACWPAGGNQIPDDAESRVVVEGTGDITVAIAAESLYIAELETETEIYELATELRMRGGANAAAPYDTLLIGNARQVSGPGTPRAALVMGDEGLQIDAERRTHTLWTADFELQSEPISAHAVRALAGSLREVDATDVPTLDRIPQTIPNSAFAGNITGWSSYLAPGGWTSSVAYDGTVGGDALGAIKFAVTVATAATLLYVSTTQIPVEGSDVVEVTAWMRQSESGASSARLGVVWYNASHVAITHALDQLSGVALSASVDHELIFTAPVPTTAVYFAVALGVTAVANQPATKWFDDVQATIVRPLRYKGAVPRVTEESRSSRWLPIVAPRRTVPNGDFATDLSSWQFEEDGFNITHTITHDPTVGGAQLGSMKINVTANTAATNYVVVLNTQYASVNGGESVTVSGWVRASHQDLAPDLVIYWYGNEGDAAIATASGPEWEDLPTANVGYSRVFAATTPEGATRYRLGVMFATDVPNATGSVWFDDIRVNDADLFLADVAMGEFDVEAIVQPRWIP